MAHTAQLLRVPEAFISQWYEKHAALIWEAPSTGTGSTQHSHRSAALAEKEEKAGSARELSASAGDICSAVAPLLPSPLPQCYDA